MGVPQREALKARAAGVAHVLMIDPEVVARLIGSIGGTSNLPGVLAVIWTGACVAGQGGGYELSGAV